MERKLMLFGFLMLFVLFASGCIEKSVKSEKIEVGYSCISCKTRDTEIKFSLNFGKEIEFNKIDIEVSYVGWESIEYYTCYPSEADMEKLKTMPPEERNEFWKKMSKKSAAFECNFKSRNLKKPGIYTFTIIAYKLDGKTYKGSVNISIRDSGLLPDFLENKTIYKLGEVIKEKPLENMFIYKVEYKDSVKVRKCEKSLGEMENNCANFCIGKSDRDDFEKCKNLCIESEMENVCKIVDYPAPENEKFVVIHYGIVAEKNKIEEKGFSCPKAKNNILANLLALGYCAIPLTIDVSAEMANSFLEVYSELGPVITTLTSFMIGFIGGTSYEISVIDEWDTSYKQYFPISEKENEKTYYYYAYSSTGFAPYVFTIPKKEKAKFLIGKSVTSGLFLLIPVKKENIIFAVDLEKI